MLLIVSKAELRSLSQIINRADPAPKDKQARAIKTERYERTDENNGRPNAKLAESNDTAAVRLCDSGECISRSNSSSVTW